MLGSSLPGVRTTATSAKEGRLKSGALSATKRKQVMKRGLTPMVKKVTMPLARPASSIKKVGGFTDKAKQLYPSLTGASKSAPTAAAAAATPLGTGAVKTSADRTANIISKVSERFSASTGQKKKALSNYLRKAGK